MLSKQSLMKSAEDKHQQYFRATLLFNYYATT